MVEKGGKGLRVLGKGERIKFYLDGLYPRFEVEGRIMQHAFQVFSSTGSVYLLNKEGSVISYQK